MTDLEFVDAVKQVYEAELAKHGNKHKAHKVAEDFRVNLRLSIARVSAKRAGLIAEPEMET
jgi:hypothetical protein